MLSQSRNDGIPIFKLFIKVVHAQWALCSVQVDDFFKMIEQQFASPLNGSAREGDVNIRVYS